MENQYTSKTIPVEDFLTYMKCNTVPLEGLNIPNITVPPHLVSKKRPTEASDSIAVDIRYLFNSLTQDNLPEVKEELNKIISEKAKNAKMLEEVAIEILDNFIMKEENVKNCMHLLNTVSKQCRLISTQSTDGTKNNQTTPTIGYYFLDKCYMMIMEVISEKQINELANLNQDDEDELDKYNRDREKINNLIATVCCLYEQRNTSNIKLTSYQLYPLINNNIIEKHAKYNSLLKDLTEDDQNYELYRKICNLYAEQVYIFLSCAGEDFLKEPSFIVKDKTYFMKDLVERFKTEVIPVISEAFLSSNCKLLKCLR